MRPFEWTPTLLRLMRGLVSRSRRVLVVCLSVFMCMVSSWALAQKTPDNESPIELAYRYYLGEVPNYEKAYELFLELASDDYPEIYYALGHINAEGLGVAVDYAGAMRWFKKAADLGVEEAYGRIGRMYDDGEGVPVNDVEAVRWYQLGADAGEVAAQNNLGTMYEVGEGVEQDLAEAAYWYCSAAAQGAPESLNNCGSMYYVGKGVPQNLELAADYFYEAAATGLPKALFNLGYIHEHAEGVPLDYEAAAGYYAGAAFGGNLDAADHLVLMYIEERGVEPSDAMYLAWHSIAEVLRGAPYDSPLVRGTLKSLAKEEDQSAYELFTEWVEFTAAINLEEAFETWPPTL